MISRQWHALYTRPRAEKKISETLTHAGITTYCPLQKTRKRWHDRYKIIEEPVFRSYVFVHIDETEKTNVLMDANVLNFVRHCGKPAVIRDEEINDIRKFLGEYPACSFTLSSVAVNDTVRIEEGLFMDYTGTVIKKMKHKACIRLELFNAYLVAEFQDTQYTGIRQTH
jgi:transcription antitermination factor NusG